MELAPVTPTMGKRWQGPSPPNWVGEHQVKWETWSPKAGWTVIEEHYLTHTHTHAPVRKTLMGTVLWSMFQMSRTWNEPPPSPAATHPRMEKGFSLPSVIDISKQPFGGKVSQWLLVWLQWCCNVGFHLVPSEIDSSNCLPWAFICCY